MICRTWPPPLLLGEDGELDLLVDVDDREDAVSCLVGRGILLNSPQRQRKASKQAGRLKKAKFLPLAPQER